MGMVDSLGNQLGPLKAWQWGVLGGGALAILVILRGKKTSGDASGAYVVLPVGQGEVKQQPAGFSSFGGLDALTSLLCHLPNAINNFSLTMPDGSQLTLGNNVPTFGNTSTILNPGQTTAGTGWNPCMPVIPPADTTTPPPGDGDGDGNTITDPTPNPLAPLPDPAIHYVSFRKLPGYIGSYLSTPGMPNQWQGIYAPGTFVLPSGATLGDEYGFWS